MTSIQKATAKDAHQVFSLLKQLFQKEKLSKKKTIALFAASLTDKESLQLVLRDQEVIGYAAAKFRNDIQVQGKVAYLSEFIIDKHQRSKGLGRRLLKDIAKQSKKAGCKEIHFPSTFKRKKAHTFYKSLGFNKTAYFFWKKL